MVFSATGRLGSGNPCSRAYSARPFGPPLVSMMVLTLMSTNVSLNISELQDELFRAIVAEMSYPAGCKP